jgi:polysaccharide biosynthesis/export protein
MGLMRALSTLFPVMLLMGSTAPAQENYEIGAGDVLKILVLGQSEMSGEYTVNTEGILSFPFLGRVKASGLTLPEMERKLTTLLADGYLRQPHVAVSVKEYHSRRVFVTGEVRRPGPYGLRPSQSLLDLLRDVGELTPDVGHEVVVIRPPVPSPPSPAPDEAPSESTFEAAGEVPATDGEETAEEPSAEATPSPEPTPGLTHEELGLPGAEPGAQIFRVSLRELQSGNPDKDLSLEPGDTVYFPKAAQVYVTGHVGRAGALRFEEGMTVYQALALAGGVTDRGSSGGVKIIRLVDGKRKELKAKPTDLVLPEDTIFVPERFF